MKINEKIKLSLSYIHNYDTVVIIYIYVGTGMRIFMVSVNPSNSGDSSVTGMLRKCREF